MNQESFQYAAEQLKNLGFGEEIAKELYVKMNQNLTEFTLPHSRTFGKDVVDSVLYFSKGDQLEKDLTFFNRFDATLKKEEKEDITQTFFIGQKYNYTLQERYNMMDGRSVYREQPKMEPKAENGESRMKPTGETYFAWRSLNFKEADKYGNFNPKISFWNHEKELQKYPIKDIEDTYDRSRILRSLEKGNKADIILLREGKETPAQMVANPRMMRIDFYKPDGQTLIVRKVEKQAVDQSPAGPTPQEVQRAAINQAAGENQHAQNQQPAQNEAQSKADLSNKQEQGQGRKRGIRI